MEVKLEEVECPYCGEPAKPKISTRYVEQCKECGDFYNVRIIKEDGKTFYLVSEKQYQTDKPDEEIIRCV